MVGHEMYAVFGKLAFDRNAGNSCRDIDQVRLGFGRFAHLVGIHRECAQDGAAIR